MAAEGNVSTSTSTASPKMSDDSLQLIEHILATNNYNLKLVPKDLDCRKCHVLEKEKRDLRTQLKLVKSQVALAKDFIGDITRAVNFPLDAFPISLEFEEKFKAHLNQIMTEYNRVQDLMKTSVVVGDLFKGPVFTRTPLPSPSGPLETETRNILIGPGGPSSPSTAENQPTSTGPPPMRNPSANDMEVAGFSGSSFSTSANLNATSRRPRSPDITFTELLKPVRKTSKYLTSNRSVRASQLSAPTSIKTVARPPQRKKKMQSSLNEQTAVRKSSRPQEKVNRFVKNSSDCPGPMKKGKEDCFQKPINKSIEESTTSPPATKTSSLAPPPSLWGLLFESSDDESSCEMEVDMEDDEDLELETRQEVNVTFKKEPETAPPPPEQLPPVLDENQQRNSNEDSSRQGEDRGDSQQNWKLAKCGYCSFKPENMEQLQSHVKEEHKYIINDLKVLCRRCNSKFTAGSFPKHACRD